MNTKQRQPSHFAKFHVTRMRTPEVQNRKQLQINEPYAVEALLLNMKMKDCKDKNMFVHMHVFSAQPDYVSLTECGQPQ
ncbi:hypothetical protein BaRGS_00039824 [Batillaria attramentaria]|uniref:Uncharacterized protein n=1 Tax=Batillaria attramentaria TaxID=370345 RepID=A0ABD0J1Z5_9CAEN